jgi:hypothetical protein
MNLGRKDIAPMRQDYDLPGVFFWENFLPEREEP